MLTEKNEKNDLNYFCKFCNFSTCKKTDYNRHILTVKHKMLTNVDNNNEKNEKKEFTCECGKIYKHRQSLSVHKKKCILLNESTSLVTIEEKKVIIELKEYNK